MMYENSSLPVISADIANSLRFTLALYKVVPIAICNSYCTNTSKELCSGPGKRSDFRCVYLYDYVYRERFPTSKNANNNIYISRQAKRNNNNRAEKKLKKKGRHTMVDSYIEHIHYTYII